MAAAYRATADLSSLNVFFCMPLIPSPSPIQRERKHKMTSLLIYTTQKNMMISNTKNEVPMQLVISIYASIQIGTLLNII